MNMDAIVTHATQITLLGSLYHEIHYGLGELSKTDVEYYVEEVDEHLTRICELLVEE